MNFFSKRPLCTISAVFILSYAILSDTSPLFKLIAGSSALCAFILLLVFRRRLVICGVLAAVILACAFSYTYFDVRVSGIKSNIGLEDAVVTATVGSVEYSYTYASSAVIHVTSINGRNASFDTLLKSDKQLDCSEFDIIRFSGSFSEIPSDNEYDMRSYRYSKGIYVSLIPSSEIDVTGRNTKNFSYYLSRISAYGNSVFNLSLDKQSSGFAKAILFGDRDNLSDTLKQDFSRLGISHMLAVSGLHLSVLTSGLYFLLYRLTVPRKLRSLILIAFSLLYIGIGGGSPSIIRAALMYSVFLLAYFAKRGGDPITSLFCAVTVIILISPNSLFDVSLILSFSSTLGILVFLPFSEEHIYAPLRKKKGIYRLLCYVSAVIITTLSATLFSLPFIYLFFGKISLILPLSNLIFAPLFTITLFLCVILLLLFPIPFVSSIVSFVASFMINSVTFISHRIASLPDLLISLRYPFVPYIIAAMLCLTVIICVFHGDNPFICALPFPAACVAFAVSVCVFYSGYFSGLHTAYRCDSTNDILCFFADNKSLYCDISTGSASASRLGINMISDEFYSCDTDYYLLTHYHRRHIATLEKVFRSQYVSALVLPEPVSNSEGDIYNSLLSLAAEYSVDIISYRYGEAFTICGSSFTISRNILERSTQPVICVSVDYNGKTAGYLSPVAGEVDASLIPESSNVLIIGTHGPKVKQSTYLGGHYGNIVAYAEIIPYIQCSDDVTVLNDESEKIHLITSD